MSLDLVTLDDVRDRAGWHDSVGRAWEWDIMRQVFSESKKNMPNSLHAILFEDRGWWILQGLEVDLAAQGRSRTEVVAEFERLLIARVLIGGHLGIEPFAALPKAPRRFWEMYRRASSSERRELRGSEQAAELPTPLPALELRTAA